MYAPILSVLLMGMIPAWGMGENVRPLSQEITVAPPALSASGRTALLAAGSGLSASGIIVMDLQSGQTIFERNATVSRPMASLTKLMTALLIVEQYEMDEIVTVPADILQTVGNDYDHLPPNDRFTVGDLLSAMLINSSNDAAVTLARFHSGNMKDFAAEMNDRAVVLGLKRTSYTNAIGLDAPEQDSTPQELAWLALYVLRYPEIVKRMSTADTHITSLSGRVIALTHTNELLHEDPPQRGPRSEVRFGDSPAGGSFVTAGKTGTTDAAGQCLLSIVEVRGRRYVVVLLNSRDRYADMRRILPALHMEVATQ